MAEPSFIEREHELDQRSAIRDTRPLSTRFGEWLAYPSNFAKAVFVLGAAGCVFPVLATLLIPTVLLLKLWFSWQEHPLPFRYPKDLGGLDPSIRDAQGKFASSDGILFLGNERSFFGRKRNREIWTTNSDARTHMLVMGTTGAGKTRTLLSICYNALTWGSGFFYSDGKADNSLWVQVWSMARRLGRDDDVLVINYMTGGRDPFEVMLKQKKASAEKFSNGMNTFSDGSADFLSQLMSTLLPKADGDGKQWQEKAINMMDAVIRALCFLRARGEIELSIGAIREYLALPKLIELYLRGERQKDLPEVAYAPIKSYLETALPGFSADKARKGKEQDQEVLNQHGYLTGQYARTLSMLMDTYGYIFKDKLSEVDMMDVMLNRRILVVMIPTMEKSSQEAANLGKLVVASMRLMMAMNLGNRLEGYFDDIIESKATNSTTPFIVTMDELGYYFAEGIAVMFAQARSLGFMMIAAGQDVPAMAKGENKNEVESMIANTKVKMSMALEDPKDTYELFQKIAGDAKIAELSGYSGGVNAVTTFWRNMFTAKVEKVSRISLQELKALSPGESVIAFGDKLVRARNFDVFGSLKESRKIPIRVNCFLQVLKPQPEEIAQYTRTVDSTRTKLDQLMAKMRGESAIAYPSQDDQVLGGLSAFSRALPEKMPAAERGIALYMEAVRLMKSSTVEVEAPADEEEESVSGGGMKPHLPKDNKPEEAPSAPAAPIDEQFDALSFLDNPPLTEKPRSQIGHYGDKPAQPAAAETEWAERAVEDAYQGEAPSTPAEPAAAGAPLEDNGTAIGLKNEVMGKLETIENLLGTEDAKEAVGGLETEVSQSLEWEKTTPQVSDLTEEDIHDIFDSMYRKLKQGDH
ncbi:MAG: phosphoesterase [Chloroflexota bacterium]|nr:MAG: phosphoesterase [Chloroflexota bacterium]